jgi:RHS repeat-associated protein
VYGHNGNNVTAGQQDYAERMNQIENQREEYYKLAGVAPGLPTMKGSYADPEVTGRGYNELITEIGDHRVPENWVQRPVVNTEEGSNPGAPLAWGSPENPDDVVAGYGYVAADTSDVEETFYYHSDHLGSTAYITDQKANVTQYDAYLPYGELLVDEHSSSADLPYKFNGKELDEETGLYYYGARYMNPITSMWYGVDPLAEKYPNVSAFVYCMGNPVKLYDPDGKDPKTWNRVWGGVRFVGGIVQVTGGVVGGIATSWTGVGAVAGGVAVVHGADDIQAGFRQLYSGETVENFTTKAIRNTTESLGVSKNTSEKIANCTDIGLGFVGSGSGLVSVFSKGKNYAKFIVDPGKYKYFFGNVLNGNAHNIQRSAQIAKDLETLGIKSKRQLYKVFADAFKKGDVVKTATTEYGTTITKSVKIKDVGEVQTGFFYKNGDMTQVPKVTTIITKIYKKNGAKN